MRISCGTTWAKGLSLSQAVELIARAGYPSIDLVIADETEIAAADAVLRRNASVINSVTVHWPAGEFSDSFVLQALEWSRGAGLSALTVVAGERRQGSVEELANQLQSVLTDCTDMHLAAANRLGSRLEQLEDFRELFVHMSDPRLRVAIDTLEFHRASVDPRAAVDELADRSDRLILADAVGREQVPLGEGEMNVASILAHAHRATGISSVSLVPFVASQSNAADELAVERRRLETMLAAR